MSYSLVVNGVTNVVEDINSSLNKNGGQVYVICSDSCKAKLLTYATDNQNSKLVVLTGVDTHQSVIERICGSEISTCYIERDVADSLPMITQHYIMSRLRNRNWCDNRVTVFWESEIK